MAELTFNILAGDGSDQIWVGETEESRTVTNLITNNAWINDANLSSPSITMSVDWLEHEGEVGNQENILHADKMPRWRAFIGCQIQV